jgi:hypothetical protein
MSKRKTKIQTNEVVTPPVVPKGRENSVSLAMGAFALSIYAYALAPSIVGGDSGELAAVLASGGIAHPPGYPLYSLLGRVFAALPFGLGAIRTNLLSALLAATTVVVLFKLITNALHPHSRNRYWIPLLCSALFAFSSLVWPYAEITEVFALNNCLLALFLFVLFRAFQEGSQTSAKVAFLLAGLGCSHHSSFIFMAIPALTAFVLLKRPKKEAFIVFFTFFSIGFTPFVYLSWLGRSEPLVAWGDPRTLKGLLTHVLRKEYGTFQLANVQGSFAANAEALNYTGLLVWELFKQTLFLAPLGFIAAGWAWREKNPKIRFLLWATIPGALIYCAVFAFLSNLPIHHSFFLEIQMRFWQVPLFVLCIWIGVGLERVRIPQALAYGAAAILAVTTLFLHQASSVQTGNLSFEKYGRSLLGPLPKDALFISRGDLQTNTTRYLQSVLGFRTDVIILDRSMASFPWMKERLLTHYPELRIPGELYGPNGTGFNLAQLIEANIEKRSVFISEIDPAEGDSSWNANYTLLPFGFIYQAFDKSKPLPLAHYREGAEAALLYIHRQLDLQSGFKIYESRSWEAMVWNDFWNAPYHYAKSLIEISSSAGGDHDSLRSANRVLASLVTEVKNPSAGLLKDLGDSYQRLLSLSTSEGDPSSATLEEQMVRAWRRYLDKQAKSDPDFQKIEAYLSVYKGKYTP